MSGERWTDHQKNLVLEAAAQYGNDRLAIAAATGVDWKRIDNLIRGEFRPRFHAAVASFYARRDAESKLHPIAPAAANGRTFPLADVQPFAVPIAAPPKPQRTRYTKAVIYGDTHFPFHSQSALDIVLGLIRETTPHIVVHLGDLVDAWQVSAFDKDPARVDTLQENIDAARVHLHQVAQVAPNSRRVLLEGNHETRLSRCIHAMQGAARELARLRVFQHAMLWPTLLDLAGVGFEFVPERQQSRADILPKIIAKHGTLVRKWSGWSAKGEWEKYGCSGVSGHTHRQGWFTHHDHNGRTNWVEAGCTCTLDGQPYGTDFDWQQGAVVMTWSEDHRLQDIEFVSIRDGRALYRDKDYRAGAV